MSIEIVNFLWREVINNNNIAMLKYTLQKKDLTSCLNFMVKQAIYEQCIDMNRTEILETIIPEFDYPNYPLEYKWLLFEDTILCKSPDTLHILIKNTDVNIFSRSHKNDLVKVAFSYENIEIIFMILDYTQYKMGSYCTLHRILLKPENVDDFRKFISSRSVKQLFNLCVPNLYDKNNIDAYLVVRRIWKEKTIKKALSLRMNDDVVGVIYEYL